MDYRVCPKCGQRHLRIHTTLTSDNDIHYEWECYWCGHTTGDYKSVTDAEQDYEKRHGGVKNV